VNVLAASGTTAAPTSGESSGLSVTAPAAALVTTASTPAATPAASYEAAYLAFEKQESGILLSAVFDPSPSSSGSANGLPTTTSDGVLNYTMIPDLPLPGTPRTTTTTAVAAPALESVTDIIAKSDADAAAALASYAKGGGLASLLDISA
jgi:hypothetical protein